jgi:hypothetical protein
VIAPARTGNEITSKIAVILIDHVNKGKCSIFNEEQCILIKVEIKLIDPKIDEIPAKCIDKILKSTDIFE